MTRTREEEEKYQGDVAYEVWRSGGNPDAVDRDRVAGYYWEGWEPEDAARSELRRQRRPLEEEE